MPFRYRQLLVIGLLCARGAGTSLGAEVAMALSEYRRQYREALTVSDEAVRLRALGVLASVVGEAADPTSGASAEQRLSRLCLLLRIHQHRTDHQAVQTCVLQIGECLLSVHGPACAALTLDSLARESMGTNHYALAIRILDMALGVATPSVRPGIELDRWRALGESGEPQRAFDEVVARMADPEQKLPDPVAREYAHLAYLLATGRIPSDGPRRGLGGRTVAVLDEIGRAISGDARAEVLLTMGVLALRRHAHSRAKECFHEVSTEHPNSPAAARARAFMKLLPAQSTR